MGRPYEVPIEQMISAESGAAWKEELERAIGLLEFNNCPVVLKMLENELDSTERDIILMAKQEAFHAANCTDEKHHENCEYE